MPLKIYNLDVHFCADGAHEMNPSRSFATFEAASKAASEDIYKYLSDFGELSIANTYFVKSDKDSRETKSGMKLSKEFSNGEPTKWEIVKDSDWWCTWNIHEAEIEG